MIRVELRKKIKTHYTNYKTIISVSITIELKKKKVQNQPSNHGYPFPQLNGPLSRGSLNNIKSSVLLDTAN